LNTLAAITGSKAGFRSLGNAWADTTTPHGMLTVLGGLAVFERDLIRDPHRRRARAVARAEDGPTAQTDAAPAARGDKRRDRGGESLADIGRSYNVSGETIFRLS
jgi:hypothetical protein